MDEVRIGAFEAKTRLSELIRETAKGKSYVITKRGKAVARLVPVEQSQEDRRREVLEELKAIRASVEETVDVLELIDDGRRF